MLIDLSKIEYKGEGMSPLKKEIWKQISAKDTIIDVGCKQGWWMQDVNRVLEPEVYSKVIRIGIDPIDYPDRKGNGLFDVYVQTAIGSENKESVKFYKFDEPGCNSLLEPTAAFEETIVYDLGNLNAHNKPRKVTSIDEVRQMTLESVLNTLNNHTNLKTDSLYYVKTDCQGTDFRAIKSLGPYIENVQYIEMEVGLDVERPLYHGSDSIEEILEEMEKLGFEPIQFSSFPLAPQPEGELLFKRKE